MNRGKCRDCGRDVIWAMGPYGSKMPFDQAATYRIDFTISWTATRVEPSDGSELYVSHNKFCPAKKEPEKKTPNTEGKWDDRQ